MTGRARSSLDIVKHQSMVSRGAKYASILKLVQNCPDELFEQEFNAFKSLMKPGVLLMEMKTNPSINHDLLRVAVLRHLVKGVKVLLANGALLSNKVDLPSKTFPIIDSVIIMSATIPVEIIRTLLEFGMDPNVIGAAGIHILARYMDRKDIMFALFDYGADIEFCLKTHNQMGSHLKNVVIATHQSWIASKAESLNVTPAKRQSKSL